MNQRRMKGDKVGSESAKRGHRAAAAALCAAMACSVCPVGSAQAATVKLTGAGDVRAQALAAFQTHGKFQVAVGTLSDAQRAELKMLIVGGSNLPANATGVKTAAYSQALADVSLTGSTGYRWSRTTHTTWTTEGGERTVSCEATIYTVSLDYDVSAKAAAKARKRVHAAASAAKGKGGATTRVAYLYDWVQKQLAYTRSAMKWSTAKALSRGKGVCQDYATTLIAACREIGIDARAVRCSISGGSHMIVRIGGKYYDASSEDTHAGSRAYYAKTRKQMRKLGIRW